MIFIDLHKVQVHTVKSRAVDWSTIQFIKFPLSENAWVCYQPRQSTARDFTICNNETYLIRLVIGESSPDAVPGSRVATQAHAARLA